ncbi:MAG: DUF1499 domain-containing protein [Filomicrobium sp.]
MKLPSDLPGKTCRYATWCGRVAVFSAALILSALFLHRLFSIPTPVALNLVKLSIMGGMLSLALAVIALIDIWRTGAKGLSTMFLGGLLAGLVVAWPAIVLPQVKDNPEINDITTDAENPPRFQTLAARRMPGANLPDYPGEVFAEQQAIAFPDLKPLLVNRSVSEAYEVSADALRRLGMKAVQETPPGDEAPAEGSIEAYDRTLIWGFYDDVMVRVIGNRLTAKIDVRSASRYGRHDLGRNAKRVRRVLKEIVARLEATVSGPRTSSLRRQKKRKNSSR